MRLKISILAGVVFVAFGCSNAAKKKTETSTVPAPQTTVVTAPTSAAATPEKKTATEDKKDETTCVLHSEKRTLKITPVQPKGCELFYSNFSSVKPVASSTMANTHCQTVHDNIREKLETAGYKCTVNGSATASATTVVTPAAKPTATPAATPAASPTPAPAPEKK